MYKFVTQWLWYSSRLCLYAVGVPEGHSTQWLCQPHTRLVSLMVTLLLCFSWGSWKESFGSLLGVLASFVMKRLLDGRLPWQFVLGFFPLWLLLAVWCLSIAGDAVFRSMVDFPLCYMVDFLLFGQSPMEIFPLSMWDDLGVRRLLGCLQAGVETLPVLLLLWNETWDIF